jgi:methanethiol S-methyltransferase
MSSALIILLAIGLYGLVHSLLASLKAKAMARGWFGPHADRTYRLVFNLFAALSFLPIMAIVALLPDHPFYTIPFPWRALSMAVQGLALLTLLVGLLQTGPWSFLGLQQLISPSTGEAPSLVIHGLYRWVRHPLYSAGLAFIWLAPVMTWNLLAFNLGLSLYLVIGATFEERKLVHEFGQTYIRYRERTPMLIPFSLKRQAKG